MAVFHVILLFHSNPVDIQDKAMMDDVMEGSTNEDISLKKEQSGYMSMLEMINDLKHSTEGYIIIIYY